MENSNQNEQAIRILKQWTLTDVKGNKHPLTLHDSDNPRTKQSLLFRKPKNWDLVPDGVVVPPVERPKPDKPTTDVPEATLGLQWEYRASVRTKRK